MKKIPWWDPRTDGPKEKQLIEKVLVNNFPNDGELTSQFENKLAKLLDCKYVTAVNNATSAMFLSLKAVGVKPRDEVIVPDITFIATANAVSMACATPILVDVDPKTLTISPTSFKRAITKKTKAVIPVHVSGRAANMEEILKIAKKHKLAAIEDAAEAFMSKHKGNFLGTFGTTGCFSLSPAKTITTGQGGFIVTNKSNLHKRLRELKDQGRAKRGTGGKDIHGSIGFNFKFTDLQAAVGLGQLTYLRKRIKRMIRNHKLYRQLLANIDKLRLLPFDIDHGEIPQWTDVFVENRDGLAKYLKENNIGFREYWYPIHQQAPYKQKDKNFPVSSRLSPQALWLPSAYTLTDADIKAVVKHIKDFLR